MATKVVWRLYTRRRLGGTEYAEQDFSTAQAAEDARKRAVRLDMVTSGPDRIEVAA